MFRNCLVSLALLAALQTGAQAAACNTPNSLVNYRNYSAGGFEFVEFKFKNPSKPDFTVAAVLPPFSDTTDRVIAVDGDQFTQIVFRSVDWLCTVKRSVQTPKRAIRDVKLIDQFEGQLEFVIGRSARSHYFSTTLRDVGAYKLVRIKFHS